MIKSIQFENFKGQSAKYNIGEKELFTGSNGTGKTTILNAIEFAIKGQISGSKKNEAIHERYASDKIMTVILETTQGDITRGLEEVKKLNKNTGQYEYTYTQSLGVDGYEKITGVRKAQEYIDTVLNIPSVAFNFSEFLDMTSTGRREFFLQLVGHTEMTKDEIIEYLKNELLIEDMDEDYKIIMEETIDSMNFDNIDTAIKWSEQAFKKYNRQKTIDKNAAIKLNQLKNELDGNVKKIQAYKDKIDEYQSENVDLITRIERSKQISNSIKNDNSTIELLNEQIKELKSIDFDKKLSELESEYKNLKEVEEVDQGNDMLDKKYELKSSINDITAQINNLEFKHTSNENIIEAERNGIARFEEELNLVRKGNVQCPLTGNICPASSDLKSYYIKKIEESIANVEKFGKENDELFGNIEELKARKSILSKELESITCEIEEHLVKYDQYKRAVKEYNERHKTITEEIAKVKNEKSNNSTKIESILENIEAIKSKIYDDVEDIDNLIDILEYNNNNIADLKANLDILKNKHRDIQNQTRTLEDSRKSSLKFTAISVIKKQLGPNGLQGDIIKRNLGEISDELTDIIHNFGKHEDFYFDTINKQGKEEFNFGWIRDGNEINFDSLSRGEQMITTAAMIKIFLEKMNSSIKLIILDEINNLDEVNLENVFKAFSEYKDMQIIICGVLDTNQTDIAKFNENKI